MIDTSKGFTKSFRAIDFNITQFRQWALFNYFLIKANYCDSVFDGKVIERGSFIITLKTIENDTKFSQSVVRNLVRKLTESRHILVTKTTNKYHHITILDYELYASDQRENNKQTTNKRQRV